MVQRLTGATLLLAALLSLCSCAAATRPQAHASASSTTGISGITVTNPVGNITSSSQPSPLPGGLGMSIMVPIGHMPLVVRDAGGAVVARLTTDGHGLFRVSLPPGTYAVFTRRKTTVVVKPGAFTRAVVIAYYHY